MATAKPGKGGRHGEAGAVKQRSEAELRSEAAFWQDMIDSDTGTLPREAVERMRHALALVEWRLAGLYLEVAGGRAGPGVTKSRSRPVN